MIPLPPLVPLMVAETVGIVPVAEKDLDLVPEPVFVSEAVFVTEFEGDWVSVCELDDVSVFETVLDGVTETSTQ